MDQHEKYEQERAISLLGLRAFPRSVGMLSGAIALLITLNPFTAFVICLGAWFITFLAKSLLPSNIVGTYLWSCCSLPVNLIGAWPVRWLLFIGMVIVAIFRGAPFLLAALLMGGILVYDLVIIITRGS